MSFANFLKDQEPEIYAEYAMELFGRDKVGKKGSVISQDSFKSTIDKDKRFAIPEGTERLSNLDENHIAYRYMTSRLIPKEHLAHMFYAPDFQAFLEQYDLDIEASRAPRIIIPFYDRDWNLQGFQGRSLPNNFKEIRYITIKLNENFPKIYGLHRLTDYETVYVTEGPIDSLFLINGVAMMGADIDHDEIREYTGKDSIVYVFDNEPRSEEIQRRMKDRIEAGYDIVIWPKHIQEKDINELILSGLTTEEVRSTIKSNTYNGMKAKLLFGEWRK